MIRFKIEISEEEQFKYSELCKMLKTNLKTLKEQTQEIASKRKEAKNIMYNGHRDIDQYALNKDKVFGIEILQANESAKLKIRYELTTLWMNQYRPGDEVPKYETLYAKQLNQPKRKTKEEKEQERLNRPQKIIVGLPF